MTEILTPEQNAQLASWSEQRDAALREISVLTDQKFKLSKEVEGLSASKTLIQDETLKLEGRLEELNKREREYEEIVSIKVAELEAKKSGLESDVTALNKEVIDLNKKKDVLSEIVINLVSIKEKVTDHVNSIESTIKVASDAFNKNSDSMIQLVAKLSESVEKIIDINNGNVKKTLEVIEDLPRIYVELRKKTIEKIPLK
jgi:chromosome segregation ATPase